MVLLSKDRLAMAYNRRVDFDKSLIYRILDNGIEQCSPFVRVGCNDFRYGLNDDINQRSNTCIVFSDILEEEYNKWLVEKILLGDNNADISKS